MRCQWRKWANPEQNHVGDWICRSRAYYLVFIDFFHRLQIAMNFVTPKQRQEWLGRAEDYTDIVTIALPYESLYAGSFLVPPAHQIHSPSSRAAMPLGHVYRGRHSHVDAMGSAAAVHHEQLECRLLHRHTFRHHQSIGSTDTLRNDFGKKEDGHRLRNTRFYHCLSSESLYGVRTSHSQTVGTF